MRRSEFSDRMNDGSIPEITACLMSGGVVVIPTDTVYGLAVLPAFPKSVDRVYELKRRPRHMYLPIMVASEKDLKSLGVEVTPAAARLLRSPLVPGSLTLAMGFGERPIPDWLLGRQEVAIRIPDDQRLLSVLTETGPLLVTSANLHGSETCDRLSDVLKQLAGAPDLAVDGGILQTVPSTVVNCRQQPPVIEREGAIATAQVMEYLR